MIKSHYNIRTKKKKEMPIIKKEKKGNITVYTVEKDYDDAKLEKKMNTFIKPEHIHSIIDHDSDVYTNEGKLLLRFRKNVLPKTDIDNFFDNVIKFAMKTTANRGSATGSKKKDIYNNPRVMSNIFGFFDRWTPMQKYIFRKMGKYPKFNVRECAFNMDFPDKYNKTRPLIEDIDELYKKLTPEQYSAQKKKANQTHFKIPNTSFTTVTTNVNYQTTIHTDKGDDSDGFGNLAVIERGTGYDGGETCFPQYGIGVDVRTGDILFMDVHQPHANLPIKLKDKESIRLSIVCYLRKNVWLNSMNKTRRMYESHRKTMKQMRKVLK